MKFNECNTESNRYEISKRIMEHNPWTNADCIPQMCAIFEQVMRAGYDYSHNVFSDKWEERKLTAWMSFEIYKELNIDIEKEITNIMAHELINDLPDGTELAYIRFERDGDEKSFSPQIKVIYGGIFPKVFDPYMPKGLVGLVPSDPESVDKFLSKYGPEGAHAVARVLMDAADKDMQEGMRQAEEAIRNGEV